MKIIRGKQYQAKQAWAAIDIANMNGITTRLHWTDAPYQWHINDGEEVFVMVSGLVDMHYREAGKENRVRLNEGDIFYATIGTEHLAVPIGEAIVLVIEKAGSI